MLLVVSKVSDDVDHSKPPRGVMSAPSAPRNKSLKSAPSKAGTSCDVLVTLFIRQH